MTASHAIETVGKFYVPGVVKYYAALTPDPWEQAHAELAQSLEGLPFELHDGPCARFVARCQELIERFKREGKPPKGVSPTDGFALGSEERVRAWQSRKGKYCVKCESKSDLTLVARADDKTQVDIVCRVCVAQPKAKGA